MSQQLVALAPQLRGEGFRIRRPGKIARVVVVIPIDVLVQVVGLEREPGTQRVETEDIIPVSYTHLDVYKRQPE